MSATPGATPISLEDTNDLLPKHISTRQELNEWERANILKAREWALSPRVLRRWDPTDERYLRMLHQRMFDETWRWAGKYRVRDGQNIGCPFVEISQRIPQLIGSVRYWIGHTTYSIDEIAVRFHHRLVGQIHPFLNGNGRHARLLADVLAVKHARPVFTWGPPGGDLVDESEVRRAYLEALRALDADDRNIEPLLAFARS